MCAAPGLVGNGPLPKPPEQDGCRRNSYAHVGAPVGGGRSRLQPSRYMPLHAVTCRCMLLHVVACCYMSLHAEVSSRHHDSGRQFTATVTVTIRVTEATGSAQAGGRCGAGRNGKHGQSIRVATEPSSSTRASSLGVPAAATAAANLRAGQANICSARQASDTAQWTTGCHPLGSTLDAY